MDHRVLIVFLWLWSSAAPDDVRLVGGASRCAGILERRDGGDWKVVNISLSEWNLTSAEMLCRQLGCGPALSLGRPEKSSRTEPPSYSGNLQITCSCSGCLSENLKALLRGERALSDPDDEVRLVGGSSTCSGGLQIKHHGEWRPADIWNPSWTPNDAAVICRRLNCGSAVSSGLMVESSDRPVWRINRECVESKSTLKECVGTENRPSNLGLEISCLDPDDEVRLVGGSSTCSGGLQIKHHGEWRPADIWNPSWTPNDAAVICRRLNCGSAVSSGLMVESSDRPVWRINRECVESKSTLKECVGTENRPSNLGLEISCLDPDDEVRLVGGSSTCSGGLQIKHHGEWRPADIWNPSWTPNDAAVICRRLNCGSAVSSGLMVESSDRPVWRINRECVESKSTLKECVGTENRPSNLGLEISCLDPDDEVRLVGGSSTCSGGLQIKHHGEWRPADIWNPSWTPNDAAVICRRLNCGSAVSSGLMVESSDRPVWRINRECVESKSTLKECVGTENRPSNLGLEISCLDSVRLVNRTGLCSGRLEVKSGQHWSPVCEEDLDLQGAQVVCRELGCGAPSVFKGGMFGEVEALFWTKKFQCEGHESALLDCPDSALTGNTCPPGKAVGLTCSDPDEVRLVGGSSTCSGGLEWRHHGEWRPADPLFHSWTPNDAAVICRRLDCGSAVSFGLIRASIDRPVWWIISECVESKSTLKECVRTEARPTNRGLEMTCSDSVRLVNRTGLCSGRLEVKSGQHWSPVCEEDLDLQGAQVVCRELGCGAPSVFKGGMFGEVEALFWTKKFQCEGHESALLDCPDSALTGNTCPPGKAVGLTCSDPDDEVRLVGGSSTCSGGLQIKHHGEWRPADIWNPSWTPNDAAVICRRLNCGSAVSSGLMVESSDRPVWRINRECVESKSTLKECVGTENQPSEFGLEISCLGNSAFIAITRITLGLLMMMILLPLILWMRKKDSMEAEPAEAMELNPVYENISDVTAAQGEDREEQEDAV
ncbi:scavenger receptor cysteine-rich type 1 protein M130-like isoform X2 [Cheilinus undulatus]|uniref:scavenger receptor cysteine-rich type 1 protein M130-like isoform X2 n=1 Tax=Cheilinus undulatus TaxID=241271 RepID=UPI001BD31C93|nr:scavenger receptor cysteine-rich type 1 protein M130-like isoform X2 [Cheilinus undulatus]